MVQQAPRASGPTLEQLMRRRQQLYCCPRVVHARLLLLQVTVAQSLTVTSERSALFTYVARTNTAATPSAEQNVITLTFHRPAPTRAQKNEPA